MTQNIKQRHVFKIKSSRLKNSKWKLQLSIEGAKENDELISIADSTTLRFIRDIRNTQDDEHEYGKIRKELKQVKKLPTSIENKRRVQELYAQLDRLLFVEDYICVVMSNKKDFDRANKGFSVNGIKFKRLLATTGGVKTNTIIYVNEEIHSELNRRIDNGRNMENEIVPAKLEAYKALTCSSSIPIDFKPTFERNGDTISRVLVVNDSVTKFRANIIKLDGSISTPPDIIYEKDYEVELEDSDGFGLISPRLSKNWTSQLSKDNYISSGFCIRNSFCKGMLFTFDFHDFARSVADNDWVTDVWGNSVNINDVDIVLTTSMLKLHDSYESVSHYLQCCKNNGHEFSVTKIIPKELENERNLNYQFIQPLKLNDNDIEELIKPTIDEIKDILGGDYKKSILFLKGNNLNSETVYRQPSDFAKALMIDKKVMDDPFVRKRIHEMIRKKINDAKIGVLKVTNANFSIISGDPYTLCQSMFGLEITGLLKSGEFYSEYWNERGVDKVAAFRAPMTCHNNIRILRLKNEDKMRYWYKYMNRCTILNSWDTTTHAMNGADKDSDTILTTNNPVILKGIVEKDAILCEQTTVKKVIPTEHDLVQANKNGFGDDIGAITNKITSMFTVQAQFDKGSKEYEELEHRIMWGQHFQQLAIDKIKGIKGAPMPKEWYSYHANIINDTDSDEIKERKRFNISILADKKPYFMCYVYADEMRKYKTYVNKASKNCLIRFGLDLDQLIEKEDKTEDEDNFIKHYYFKMPVNIYPSLMNKICYIVETETDGILKQDNRDFDYNILKNNSVEYSKSDYDKIKKLYNKYKKETQRYFVEMDDNERLDGFTKSDMRKMFIQRFKVKAENTCSNKDELCNIVLDLCYTTNESKQFSWDICGDTIIKNLLIKNNYKMQYLEIDNDGDIEFNGLRFFMKEVHINKEELDEDNIR